MACAGVVLIAWQHEDIPAIADAIWAGRCRPADVMLLAGDLSSVIGWPPPESVEPSECPAKQKVTQAFLSPARFSALVRRLLVP